jgi:cyclin T
MVFYHRFFAFKSYEDHDRFNIATTALFLASKVEETPRKLKDVVTEAYKTQYKGTPVPEPESRELYERKEKVLISERILLQTLGFDLSIEHPYRHVAPLP